MLAKAVANEANCNFIAVKSSEVLSKWYGDSERRIEEFFRRARQVAPAILFFDEIDSLVPARGQGAGEPQVTARIVNQFLAELDGLEELRGVVVVGATNRPDIVDPALMRPGRFDEVVYVPLPDLPSRLAILRSQTQPMSLSPDVDLDWLAGATERFTGADLTALVKRAAMLTLRGDTEADAVGKDAFLRALEQIRPSVTEEVERFYQRAAKELTRGKRALGFRVGSPEPEPPGLALAAASPTA
jgi:transitional endoplasmic reticulum ATPase